MGFQEQNEIKTAVEAALKSHQDAQDRRNAWPDLPMTPAERAASNRAARKSFTFWLLACGFFVIGVVALVLIRQPVTVLSLIIWAVPSLLLAHFSMRMFNDKG